MQLLLRVVIHVPDLRQALRTFALALAVAGCSGSNLAESDHRYLDTGTGTSVSALPAPLVFYHDEPRLAANARDYIYLGPLELNRGGTRSYYLWFGDWTMLDRLPGNGASDAQLDKLLIVVDGIPLELTDSADAAARAAISEPPYQAPLDSITAGYMQVSRDQLNNMAAAETIYLKVSSHSAMRVYRLWKGDISLFDSVADDSILVETGMRGNE